MKIPDNLVEVALKDVLIGESVYVVPWAMYAETDGELFINGKYDFHLSSFRTSQMKLTRMKDGFVVDISNCRDEKWSPSGACYVGGSLPIPVIGLEE